MSVTSVPASSSPPANHERLGLLLGLLGVIAFSLTLPMTRTAVAELNAWFVAFGRMAIAGVIAAGVLWLTRAPRPARHDLALFAWTSLGVVIGFPLCSSLAMRNLPANHGAIINGALPFATALLAALWFGERHTRRFWVCAATGSLLVVAFALRHGGVMVGADQAWMAAAVLLGALGYVAGARLAATYGGLRTIMWALVLALPLTLPVSLGLAFATPLAAGTGAWAAFAYVTVISQVLGFYAWYNGLALGGIARVGQTQLLQAFFTIAFAALLFGEHVDTATWLFAAAVVACIIAGRTGRHS
jgi:drug/metabolite transporter (DMT)-like permease